MTAPLELLFQTLLVSNNCVSRDYIDDKIYKILITITDFAVACLLKGLF